MTGSLRIALSAFLGLTYFLSACTSSGGPTATVSEPAAPEAVDDTWELGVFPSNDQLNTRFAGMKVKDVSEQIRTDSQDRYSVSQVIHWPVRDQRVVLPMAGVGISVTVDHDDIVTDLRWVGPTTR